MNQNDANEGGVMYADEGSIGAQAADAKATREDEAEGTPLQKSMGTLHRAITSLDKLTALMSEKLGPVLHPEESVSAEKDGGSVPRALRSEHVMDVENAQMRLAAIIRQWERLHERLEV